MSENLAKLAESDDERMLGSPGTSAFQVELYPFYLLNRLVSRYNTVIGARLEKIGLDIPTWRVLMILGERCPRSIKQISDTGVINLSTMTRIIQRMAAAGLVRCEPSSSDNRVTEVLLSPLGKRKLGSARAAAAPIYEQVIRGFSRADFVALIEMLNRLHENLASDPDPS